MGSGCAKPKPPASLSTKDGRRGRVCLWVLDLFELSAIWRNMMAAFLDAAKGHLAFGVGRFIGRLAPVLGDQGQNRSKSCLLHPRRRVETHSIRDVASGSIARRSHHATSSPWLWTSR